MFVIANKIIPENKRVAIALTYVYGIGRGTALKILKEAMVENKKVKELVEEEMDRLLRESEKFTLENKLREEVQKRKNIKISLGTYHGRRLEKGLPVHGQSTHHNSRTVKRLKRGGSLRKIVANKKKAKK